MRNNELAILLPVYTNDSPSYFSQAVESILKQTYSNFYLYIGVDGPVQEELSKLIEKFEQDIRVKAIWFEKNRGLACVLNDLIFEARKENVSFLARMDADDESLPDRMEKQISFLINNPDIDVVGGAIEEIDSEGNFKNKIVKYPLTHFECKKFFRYRDPLAHPATLFRIRYFDKVKGYRSEYRKNQDTMLWFDGFLNDCKFSNIPEIVLKFRVNESFYDRRDGFKRAKQMFVDRIKINKALKYDVSSYIFAILMFGLTLSPTIIKKLLYKFR